MSCRIEIMCCLFRHCMVASLGFPADYLRGMVLPGICIGDLHLCNISPIMSPCSVVNNQTS